jgi:hypothetical protein
MAWADAVAELGWLAAPFSELEAGAGLEVVVELDVVVSGPLFSVLSGPANATVASSKAAAHNTAVHIALTDRRFVIRRP